MKPFIHQVAGHAGTLFERDGKLMKRATAREIAFYTMATTTSLREWIPRFHGVHTQFPDSFVVLDNLVAEFHRPCVADLKLGTVLAGPDATIEKKERMHRVSQSTTSGLTGTRICGMQYWNGVNAVRHDSTFGKQLDIGGMHAALEEFLEPCKDIFSEQIKMLHDTVSMPSLQLASYGASLLVIYDAADPTTLQLKLIDFAHTSMQATTGGNNGILQGVSYLLDWAAAARNEHGDIAAV